jgi:hypothetical protein
VNLPAKPLRTVTYVAELPGETINQVRRGELDLPQRHWISFGHSAERDRKGSLEERLAALEAVLANPDHSNNNFSEHESFDFVPTESR